MTSPVEDDWTYLVEFLEARIGEQESAIRVGTFASGTDDPGRNDKASLSQLMLDECAQKRAIIASWKEAADAEGITDLSEAEGTVAVARRSMLTILAGSHREHPDYDPAWSPDLPTELTGETGPGFRLQ
ncbi:DUF6221 family protein [Arthrobacter sp. PsM3]|uniref:DUF6221 family protein n=1 Tax=Arthrobacter sp. PsM3 TaxID=3030531 RepID=UPI00263B8698|nr:DUF6221 family protein [Arthrobacter sp. PsM3]MDN4644475.1 DUF6221 family protein [Arthrobacter sp. PsM3]